MLLLSLKDYNFMKNILKNPPKLTKEQKDNINYSKISDSSISVKCAEFIKPFEGFSPVVYKCPAGVDTFGYGSLVKDFPNVSFPITESFASELLIKDIERKYLPSVLRLCKCKTENQIIACVSFCYNLGSGNLQASTLRAKINRGDFSGASKEFLRWDKARVNGILKTLRGLTIRRQAESKLFLS